MFFQGSNSRQMFFRGCPSVWGGARSSSTMRLAAEEMEVQVKQDKGRPPQWKNNGSHADRVKEYLAIRKKKECVAETKQSFGRVHLLTIPNPFVKCCFPYKVVDRATCKLQDSRGDEWRMILKFNKKNGERLLNCMLGDGFRRFVATHELPKNAILVLELVSNKASFVFKTTSFTN